MNRLSSCAVIVSLSAVLAASALSLLAQPESPPHAAEVREAGKEARSLQEQGRWDEALELLRPLQRRCRRGPQAEPCLLLDYSLGFLYQKQSSADPGSAQDFLNRAAAYYERVLEQRPDHGPTLNNLSYIYKRMKDGRYEAHLKKARQADKTGQSAYGMRLGDVYAARKDWDQAARIYREAVEQGEGGAAARMRLINAYRRLPKRWPDLFKLCQEWEQDFPREAEGGYLRLIRAAHGKSSGLADRALVGWVDLKARQKSFSPHSLSVFPEAWDAPSVQGLREFLESPRRKPSSENWWMSDAKRRNTLASAAWSLGQFWLLDDKPRWTEDCWTAAWRFSPPFDAYLNELREEQAARLDLLTDLAALYFRHPDLDPVPQGEKLGRKTQALIDDLFVGKGTAYEIGDLEGIQRHHAILGTIFYRAGVWTSEHPYANAVFQLRSAIRFARERDFHQPQATLKEYLGRSYAAARRPRRAAAAYLDAARAYLDLDQFDEAARALGAGRELGAEAESVDSLNRIARWRQRVPAASASADMRPHPQRTPWFYDSASGDQQFLARQRFKVLADAAESYSRRDPEAVVTLEAASQAMAAMMDEKVSLSGTADLIRLQKVRDLVSESTGYRKRKLVAAPGSYGTWTRSGTESGNPAAPPVRMALPGGTRPVLIQLDSDALEAQKIHRELGAETIRQAQPSEPLDETVRPALRNYLLGSYYAKRGEERQGLQYFEKAVQEHSAYLKAYEKIAECYEGLARSGEVSRQEAQEKAGQARARAAALRARPPGP